MWRRGWWGRAIPAAIFWFLAYVYLSIPDVRPLARENPVRTAFMDLRDAEVRRDRHERRHVHRWVPYLVGISGNLKRAVLVAEDSAFWQHEGLDFEQIRESMEVNFERMEFARGASTITQQLAKNLYLSPSRNPVRKLRELFITRRLEAVLSKRRILELYLNVIEWGDGVWGAEAASRAYFRKTAAALSAEDAALLAGAIINPRVLNPGDPSARLRRRQRLVLRRMGHVTPPPDPMSASAPAAPLQPSDDSDRIEPGAAPDEGPMPQPVEPRSPTPSGSFPPGPGGLPVFPSGSKPHNSGPTSR